MTGNSAPAPLTSLTPPAATPAPAGPSTARIRHGFTAWPADVAARKGSDALTAGRPGSHEASPVGQLVKGTVGYADQHLPPPRPGRAPVSSAVALARSMHVICELARIANCGHCWARPQQPCAAGRDGAEGYHLARFARAERRGLISAADFDAVLATAGDDMFNGAAVVFDDMPGGR
jgi:hypothetical protein